MKNKILKITLLGITILGLSSFAAGKKISYSNYATKSQKGYIGESRARAIALSRIPGAKNRHVVKLKLDREDGRMVYEGKVLYNGLEYEFDIDAVTGRVVSWDVDRD